MPIALLKTHRLPLPRRSQGDLPDETSARPRTACELSQASVRRRIESRRQAPARAKAQSQPVGTLPALLEHQGPQSSARCREASRSWISMRHGHHGSNLRLKLPSSESGRLWCSFENSADSFRVGDDPIGIQSIHPDYRRNASTRVRPQQMWTSPGPNRWPSAIWTMRQSFF